MDALRTNTRSAEEGLLIMLRRSLPVTVASTLLVFPFAAVAQSTGSVTTDPFGQSAPTLTMPLIFLLTVMLAGIAVYHLRRTVAQPIVVLILVVTVTVLAGLGHAITSGITISGADCMKQTTRVFDPFVAVTTLTSNCPNAIQIVDIQNPCITDVLCDVQNLPSPCQVGQTLANGDVCSLPSCVC